jgi:hypothetical protein
MSIVVKMSLGERFINWFPFKTKLFLRGEKGADHAKSDALYAEIAAQFSEWCGKIVTEEVAQQTADLKREHEARVSDLLVTINQHIDQQQRIADLERGLLFEMNGHRAALEALSERFDVGTIIAWCEEAYGEVASPEAVEPGLRDVAEKRAHETSSQYGPEKFDYLTILEYYNRKWHHGCADDLELLKQIASERAKGDR